MGTRAVVRANLHPHNVGKDIFIGTHWDGNPDVLGETLKKSIKKELEEVKDREVEDVGGAIQRGVFKGAADHHIDTVSTLGEEEFNQKYGDFAEYVYRITPEGLIEWTTEYLEGDEPGWSGFKEDADWNVLEKSEELKDLVQQIKKDKADEVL